MTKYETQRAVSAEYPKRKQAFSSLLDFNQETEPLLNSSSASIRKQSKESFELVQLIKRAEFLSPSEIKKIQKKVDFPDFPLIFANMLPRFYSEDDPDKNGQPEVYLRNFSRKPILFSEVPSGYALWQEDQRMPLNPSIETIERENKEREGERRQEPLWAFLLLEFIKTIKETATPKQWQIARMFFINKYFQEGRVLAKDMAKELNIPASTFTQQLKGRPRNGKRIGGAFSKAIKKMRKDPEILALAKKEEKLFKLIFKEQPVKKNTKIGKSVKSKGKNEKT
jgi:hypothetical protein